MKKNIKFWLKKYPILLIGIMYLFVSILVLIPMYRAGFLYYGDDISFHINRMVNIYYNTMHGNLMPIISTYSFKGTGSITNLIYPYPFLYLFVGVHVFVSNGVHAVYITLMLVTFLTMISSHYALFTLKKSHRLAIIFSFLYTFSAYRMLDMLARFDLGEIFAFIGLPLAVIGMYHIMFKNENYWWMATVGSVIVVYSHVISILMIIIFMVVLIGYRLIESTFLNVELDSVKIRIMAVLKFGISTILLTIYQTLSIIYGSANKLLLPSHDELRGIKLADLLTQSITNSINRTTEMGIGIFLVFVLFYGFMCLSKINREFKRFYFLFVVFTFIVTTMIPWQVLEKTPLAVIQFPFRFLELATIMGSISGAYLLNYLLQKNVKVVGLIIVILIVTFSSVLNFISYARVTPYNPGVKTLYKNTEIFTSANSFAKLSVDEPSIDYFPKQNIKKQLTILRKKVLLNNKNDNSILKKSTPLPNGMKYKVEISKKGKVDLPFLYYKEFKYNVTVDGKAVNDNVSQRKTHLIYLDKGKHIVKIKMITPGILVVGLIVNLAMYLIIGLLVIKRYFRQKS